MKTPFLNETQVGAIGHRSIINMEGLEVQVRRITKSMAQKFGYKIIRISPSTSIDLRRQIFLGKHNVNVVVDIGANTGQYGQALRAAGYDRRLISFEPIPEAYDQLRKRSTRDKAWECYPIAIGGANGAAQLNVSVNSASSSILPALNHLVDAAPGAATVRALKVPLCRLDSALDGLVDGGDKLLVKMDVQGYEDQVLDGALITLQQACLVETELSLVSLYDGQALYRSTIDRLYTLGFTLVSLDSVLADEATGRLLQMDGLFELTPGQLGRPRPDRKGGQRDQQFGSWPSSVGH
jgi:FkbM family methyltransferase